MDRNEAWGADRGNPPAGAAGRIDLLSVLPLVAIVLLVALIGALAWLVNRDEAESARVTLATDALWVEQTLRFQLSNDEDMLVRLALDQGRASIAPEILHDRARLHVANNPEVLAIGWYDAEGRMLNAIPHPSGNPAQRSDIPALFQRAANSSARPVYGELIRDPDGGLAVDIAVKTANGQGVVVARLSLALMIERQIPWWIGEQYAVQLLDASGAVLAEKARVEPEAGAPSHSISFDPPIVNTVLRIAPYQAPGNLSNKLLLGGIAGLAAFAIVALLVLQRNSAERRRAEMRLRGEMAFRRSMEESLTVGLRAKDHQGRVLYVNQAFCQMVDLPAAELVGRVPPMPYWSPARMEETLARQQALEAGGAQPQSFETRFRRRDGSEIDVQVYEAPLIDAEGAHRGWMGSVIDITEAKRATAEARGQQESLQRTGRLVTLGEMASTLAHELNQPLAAIAGYAAGALNLLRDGRAAPTILIPPLEKLAHQAGRAGHIIRRIQDFARKREPKFTPVVLGDVIADTVSFLAADAREHNVRLVTRLQDLPAIPADRILLEQVLINLIRNGMEAMVHERSGDTLEVTLSEQETGYEIAVADRGPGIVPELAGRMFDAFATSKADGMGMGLNICRTIVELHRGQLAHRPNPEGGTIFVVTLPAAAMADRVAAQ